MIIPLFQDTVKAPNNATVGLSRSASITLKSAISSDDFEGKEEEIISIWTKQCQIILLGMGENSNLDTKKSRDIGAKCFSNLTENKGKNIVIRFTTGWNTENMASFAEGMILRDYTFDKYQKKINDKKQDSEWKIVCQPTKRLRKNLDLEIKKLSSIATGVHLARDLGNQQIDFIQKNLGEERKIGLKEKKMLK